MGGRIIAPTTRGRGPYNYKIGGQNHHLIGSLLPPNGARPKFSQLYIYDTEDEVRNRKTAASTNKSDKFEDRLVAQLQDMIDQNNPLAKTFRMARDSGIYSRIPKAWFAHAHILLFMHQQDKYPVASDIDKIISTELPDEGEDPELYQAITEFMMHGPCGAANTNAPCEEIIGSTVDKGGVHLDNRYVVPYNAKLLRKYRAHINVEWCNQSRSIKYLFKYINKGYDRVTATTYQDKQKEGEGKEIDEIKMYYDCRYILACEAIWRIFGFNIHYRTPAVERLSFHLPGEQTVLFNDHADVESILDSPYRQYEIPILDEM
ncbi:uncharacterized protein LOC130589510 [Beta vulgaris subsp. vulgaris]|uniref:uncharacterized protein LOC130589510 n=1 Tax=Beta vulgaris subsp. vulgaris TaxID=3555 RepID=UPI002548213D|nr:uncharacterized protein LOC130589510 [Beta vulgaris subsp. vulgaris]